MKKLEGASPDAPKFFGSAGALPSRKPLAIRYSPFATHRLLPSHQSPIASRYSLSFCTVGWVAMKGVLVI